MQERLDKHKVIPIFCRLPATWLSGARVVWITHTHIRTYSIYARVVTCLYVSYTYVHVHTHTYVSSMGMYVRGTQNFSRTFREDGRHPKFGDRRENFYPQKIQTSHADQRRTTTQGKRTFHFRTSNENSERRNEGDPLRANRRCRCREDPAPDAHRSSYSTCRFLVVPHVHQQSPQQHAVHSS